jgi:hypothetical protein
MEKIIVGHFLRDRPSLAPTLAHSRMRSQPVTTCAPQSLTAGTHLSAPISPIPSPAPADPHRRRYFDQTATRASSQGCLVLPHPILSLLANDCGSYCHLTSTVSSLFRCSVVPSLHGGDAGARSLATRPRAAHPADGDGAAKGVPSRPWCSPASVRAWPPRCGALVHLLAPRGHHSAHPFQHG